MEPCCHIYFYEEEKRNEEEQALVGNPCSNFTVKPSGGCGGNNGDNNSQANTGNTNQSDTGDTETGELEGDIVFWHSFTQGPRMEKIQAAADEFMELHPKVNITIETFSWADFYTKWTTGLRERAGHQQHHCHPAGGNDRC